MPWLQQEQGIVLADRSVGLWEKPPDAGASKKQTRRGKEPAAG
jgi:hypothetical protein